LKLTPDELPLVIEEFVRFTPLGEHIGAGAVTTNEGFGFTVNVYVPVWACRQKEAFEYVKFFNS
jgi:hypothetical protein